MANLREVILSAQDRTAQPVEVPEWGCTVYVRPMTAAERDAFEGEIVRGGKVQHDNLRARLLVRCLCDDAGARLFTDKDVAELGGKNAAVVDRLFSIAQTACGLSGKDVEQLAKNSGGAPGVGSPSA